MRRAAFGPDLRPTMRRAALALGVAGLAVASAALPAEQPLLEFGLGAGAVAFEDYRGSGTTHAYPVPVPYFLYNGKFLKSDRQGVRGTLFDQDWVELNLSGNATTPVRHDSARNGMPDLKSTLEVGPSLDFHLWRSADSRLRLDLRLPLRAALAVESPPHFIGWTFTPRLAVDVADPLGYAGWNLGVLAGPLFAARRYDDYFYSVAPGYATAERPAYEAGGGYAGTQTITALSKRFARYWVGAYVRADTLSGAAFAASPLVQRKEYWSAGFGFAWILHSSSRMVDVPD
jgi:outer membrane scaffolding protein for murein synthesis (MipA/OmpV family)